MKLLISMGLLSLSVIDSVPVMEAIVKLLREIPILSLVGID